MKTNEYASKKIIVLAVVQIVLGCFAISLGIPAAVPTTGSFPWGHLGYGIWGGILYIINGCVGIAAGCSKSKNLIIWHLVLSICSAVMGCLQLSLGIASAGQDYYILKIKNLRALATAATPDPLDVQYSHDLDKFVELYFPMTFMLSRPDNRITAWLHPGMVAVDSLLACGGFLVAFFAVLSAASGCKVTCCSNLREDYDIQGVTVAHHHQQHQPQIQKGQPEKVMSVPMGNMAYQTDP